MRSADGQLGKQMRSADGQADVPCSVTRERSTIEWKIYQDIITKITRPTVRRMKNQIESREQQDPNMAIVTIAIVITGCYIIHPAKFTQCGGGLLQRLSGAGAVAVSFCRGAGGLHQMEGRWRSPSAGALAAIVRWRAGGVRRRGGDGSPAPSLGLARRQERPKTNRCAGSRGVFAQTKD